MENRNAFIGMTTKPTSKELVAALGTNIDSMEPADGLTH